MSTPTLEVTVTDDQLSRAAAWARAGLPDVAEELELALKRAVLGTWPADEKYREAEQPQAIADVLIPQNHDHLINAKIAYLFQEKLTSRGTHTLAKAKKTQGKLAWEAWKGRLNDVQRVALVDHELCHCDLDLESGKWRIRHHDVEEFSEIVKRWGAWQDDLAFFVRQVQQLELGLDGAGGMTGEHEREGRR